MDFAQSKSRGQGKQKSDASRDETALDKSAPTADSRLLPGYALGHGAPAGLSLLGGAIQTKLAVGAANDPYEREADSVADHVVSDKAFGSPPAISTLGPGALTQTKRDEEEEPPVQRQPEDEEEPVQTKALSDRSGREGKKEPDKAAEEPVQRQAEEDEPPVQAATDEESEETPVQRQGEDDEEPVQAKSVNPDRKRDEDEEGDRKEGARQNSSPGEAEREVRNRGGGEPLPEETRGKLEPRLGVDLSDVRVHTGAQSEQATKSLRARAFTNRNHIWLAPGERPNDLRLMAHEATHVVQQNGVARRPPQQTEAGEAGSPNGKPFAEAKPLSPTARPDSKPGAEAETAPPAPAAPTTVPAAKPTAEPQRAAPSTEGAASRGLAPASPTATAPVAQPLQAPPGGPVVASPLQAPGAGAATATPEAKGPATEKTGAGQPAIPEAKSKAEAEAKEAAGKDAAGKPKEGKEKGTAEGKPGVKAGAETAGAPAAEAQPAEAKEVLPEMGAQASETGAAPAPTPASEESAAGAGAAPTEAGAGGEEAVANSEQAQAETEQRMAAAAGEKEAVSESEATEEEAAGETGTAEEAADADNAAAEMVPGAAGGASEAATTDSATPAESPAESEAAPETGGGGAALEEAETAADEAAKEESAATEEAESPQPAPGEPSSAELASAGAPEMAEEAQAEEPAPAAEAMAEESSEAGSPAADTGPSSAELSPAERDAATASMTEGAGAEGEPSGGGGGGGGAITEKPEPEVPDVSASDPSQAMAQISNLPPGKMVTALTGVNQAVNRSVGEQRTQLAENPPQMERPSGSPVTKQSSAKSSEAPVAEKAAPTERVPEGQSKPTPQPEPMPSPPPSPAQSIAPPQIKGDEKGEMSDADISEMKSSVSSLPTRDPALETSAGPAPTVALEGAADPAQTQKQRAKLEQSVAETQAQGRRDAAQPLGEGDIYPTVPQETLRANVPGGMAGAAAGGAGGAGLSGETGDAVSIIAQEKSGGEIQASVAKAQGDMAAERAKHDEKVAEEQTKSKQEIAKLESENAEQQQGERSKAQAEAQQARQDWTAEQQKAVEKRREEADQVNQKGATDIETTKTEGEAQAAQSIETGNQEAATAQAEGEQKAEAEKKRSEEESSGFFGWLSSKATSFFNSIKEGIKAAMDAARRAVKAAIEKAKQLAVAAIEKARQAIVSAIRWVGDQLIAIGDKLLADFPGLHDRFRNSIKEKVAAAEAAVNKLADALKEGVKKALDFLGAALDAALGLLEKGLLAAVDAVNAVVQGAIKAAKAVADAIGTFVVLIKDIAAGPGKWIRNLGAAVVDGIKNHLWKAFKTAVMNWFNQKLEEVLGLGAAIWGILTKGGIKLADIGKMAWEGIKSAIPPTLIQILVEKLVAMIVPAAGAVMVIIEGLQAAWGTISRILQAIQKFIAFLKAVKGGSAGPPFASAVAAAAIAVIDLVANWLIRRLRKPAGKVGGAVKAMAQRILQKLKAVAKKIGQKLKGVAKKIGAKLKKFGAKIKGKFKKITGKFKKKGKKTKKPKKPKKSKRQKAQERLDRAVNAIRPQVERMLARGSSKFFLRGMLLYWRIRYRLSALTLSPGGQIVARVNPSVTLANGEVISAAKLGAILEPIFIQAEQEYREKLLEQPEIKKQYDKAKRKLENGEDGALHGVPRDVQQMALRDAKPPVTPGKSLTTFEAEQGVKISSHESGHLGRTEVKMGGLSSYEAMLASIKRRATAARISHSEIASVLAAHPKTMAVKFNALAFRLPAGNNTQIKNRDSFINTLRRASFLTQTLEPARKSGIASATAVSSSLVAGGHNKLHDILGPEGKLAPMTPKGAASERDTSESRKAQKKRVRRVGNIFATLLNVAKQGKIVATPGGGDLSALARAMRALLENRLRNGKLDVKRINALKAQIKVVLAKYNGR
jgi:hypothetical protein